MREVELGITGWMVGHWATIEVEVPIYVILRTCHLFVSTSTAFMDVNHGRYSPSVLHRPSLGTHGHVNLSRKDGGLTSASDGTNQTKEPIRSGETDRQIMPDRVCSGQKLLE